MWDQVALDLAAASGYSEARTARTVALLNMAMMDACIASWETKFHYLVPRPSMRDRAIREPLGLPAHPSYTSGHSAFSGAAEGILSAIFPESADEMHRLRGGSERLALVRRYSLPIRRRCRTCSRDVRSPPGR